MTHHNEADRLAEQAQRLDAFLAQFDLDEQERILRYALDHVVPKLKGQAALAKQQAPEATAEPAAVPVMPHVGADESGAATLEWWNGARKLTLYLCAPAGEALLKSWGPNIETEMAYVPVTEADQVREAFAWLAAHGTQKAEAALSSAPAEALPVAEIIDANAGCNCLYERRIPKWLDGTPPVGTKLYATPQKAEATQAAAGWKLLKDTTHAERSHPEAQQDGNGNLVGENIYSSTCGHCLREFLGWKRRGVCAHCAAHGTQKAEDTQAAQAVPEGYALVPKAITEEMHASAVRTIVRCSGHDDWPHRVWLAMLAASQ